jgi:hypothetical protein
LARSGVRGTFSQPGPSHPAASGRLTRTLGLTQQAPHHFSQDEVARPSYPAHASMEHPPSYDDGRPPFDIQFANELIGKRILVGITITSKREESTGQEQFSGVVISADPERGFTLMLEGKRKGEKKWLPPATHVFMKAEPGTYTLRTTGEDVVDPDYTSTWVLTRPDA